MKGVWRVMRHRRGADRARSFGGPPRAAARDGRATRALRRDRCRLHRALRAPLQPLARRPRAMGGELRRARGDHAREHGVEPPLDLSPPRPSPPRTQLPRGERRVPRRARGLDDRARSVRARSSSIRAAHSTRWCSSCRARSRRSCASCSFATGCSAPIATRQQTPWGLPKAKHDHHRFTARRRRRRRRLDGRTGRRTERSRPATRRARKVGGSSATAVAFLVGVTALSFVLNAWGVEANGLGNTYYAAAARSMASSWHNWFFNAFDPGGYITVDKPPVATVDPGAERAHLRLLVDAASCCRARSPAQPPSRCSGAPSDRASG